MKHSRYNTLIIMLIAAAGVCGQNNQKWELDGQLSLISSYSPDNNLIFFAGGRYLPELSYEVPLDTNQLLDFEAAANISGSVFFRPFDEARTIGNIQPYRLWARYTGKQFEIRGGLQKIDFGSASLLRPLQWFNQIDPRDPLQLTNGVYGLLGRYYFLNNANIWLWTLYGNEETRGFDAVPTYSEIPEFGGRFQYPTPNGEIALSYHHRAANSEGINETPSFTKIPENRIGLDGKWDVTVGLWFEASYIHKSRDVGILTNQTLFSIGSDYTFGVGNGLNMVGEHLFSSLDNEPFELENPSHVSALSLSYPLGLWDNLNFYTYYNWPSEDFTFFFNYEYQFNKFSGYVMAFHNPSTQAGIQQNELINNFTGSGIRVMVVYNH